MNTDKSKVIRVPWPLVALVEQAVKSYKDSEQKAAQKHLEQVSEALEKLTA